MISYFESHGARCCKSTENPAEWLMEVTSQSYSESECIDWADIWQHSDIRLQVKERIQQMTELSTTSRVEKTARQAPSIARQLERTTLRLFSHYWRTPSYIYSKTLLCTFTVSRRCTTRKTTALTWTLGSLYRILILEVRKLHSRPSKPDLRGLSSVDSLHQPRSADH